MSNNSKWGVFWLLVIGAFLGILITAATVRAVQWAGSNDFCTGWCHSMDPVAVSYKKGQHGMTASGATAGCSDCHLLNETQHPLTPTKYVALLANKAKAGSISAFGHVTGSINTPEKWLEKHAEMSKNVMGFMKDSGFSNCRGCHDLSKMHNPKKPFVGKLHQGFIEKPETNCVMCHKNAGHNYTDVEAYIKAENKWPTEQAVEEFVKKNAQPAQ